LHRLIVVHSPRVDNPKLPFDTRKRRHRSRQGTPFVVCPRDRRFSTPAIFHAFHCLPLHPSCSVIEIGDFPRLPLPPLPPAASFSINLLLDCAYSESSFTVQNSHPQSMTNSGQGALCSAHSAPKSSNTCISVSKSSGSSIRHDRPAGEGIAPAHAPYICPERECVVYWYSI